MWHTQQRGPARIDCTATISEVKTAILNIFDILNTDDYSMLLISKDEYTRLDSMKASDGDTIIIMPKIKSEKKLTYAEAVKYLNNTKEECGVKSLVTGSIYCVNYQDSINFATNEEIDGTWIPFKL